MSNGEPNNSKSGVLTKALLWAGGVVTAALLPGVESGSTEGVSHLLAIVYLATWVALGGRHALHLLEGYYGLGMGRAMVCELGTVIVWGLTAALVITADNPQIPRLAICGGGVALVFFFSSTRMEALRAKEMRRRGVRIRRATEVLRESYLWSIICRSFGQLDFEFTRRVRDFLGGPDSKAGNLSLLAATLLFAPLIIALVTTGVVVASTVFPIQLTPDHSKSQGSRSHRGGSGKNCGGGHAFGAGVPEPERSSLRLGWEEAPGAQAGPMEALGYEVAGCPGRASPVPGQPGSWYAAGYCGEELRSIVLAPKGLEHPIVLLEQAADFVHPLIIEGELVRAVDRFSVGEGDAYIVDTRDGSYVLIRDRASDGPVEAGDGAGRCEGFSDHDVRYTIVEPGLIEAWRAVAAISIGGVYPISYTQEGDGSRPVAFRSPEGIMATAVCSVSTMTCEVMIGGERIHGRRGTFIDENEVKALVEG